MLPQKGDGVLRSIQMKCLTSFTAALQVVHPESISSAIEAGGFMLLFAAFSTDVLVIRVAFVLFCKRIRCWLDVYDQYLQHTPQNRSKNQGANFFHHEINRS